MMATIPNISLPAIPSIPTPAIPSVSLPAIPSVSPSTLAASALSQVQGKLPGALSLGAVPSASEFVSSIGKNASALTENFLKISGLNGGNPLDALSKKFKVPLLDSKISVEGAIAAASKGINTALENLPKCASIPFPKPITFPELPGKDFQGKSPKELAKMFGVLDPSKIPGASPDMIKSLLKPSLGSMAGLLNAKNLLPIDASALKDGLASASGQLSGITGSLGQAVESAQSSLGSISAKSAASVFGSKSATSAADALVPVIPQFPSSLPIKT